MFWGRLSLQNAYGSGRVPLAMPFRTGTYDGTAFVANTLDDCTSVALNRLSLSNGSGTVTADNPITVGSGSSSASLSDPFSSGDAGLVFSAPGSEGDIQVQVDLSSLFWLQYDWDGDGTREGPSARATFGIYKGSQHHIYLRETYR
jgi:MSHA biogenesis protein MshQ